MRIEKTAGTVAGTTLTQTDLAQINALARRTLKAEEVYTFCMRLCDNEVDRDGERFPEETLAALADRFVGKSGLFDHQWSAASQVARIYQAELVREEGRKTGTGEGYCYLKGYAYLLRTEKNRDLIAEIEGGIKKEVSVGCAVKRACCSICGAAAGSCAHVKGEWYGGKLCCTELLGVTDAYEWSFVAVPAQPMAGVIKGMGRSDLDRQNLEREAAVGRKYLARLREETVRLGALAEPDLDCGVLRTIVDKLEEGELWALQKAYEGRLEGRFPPKTQLHYQAGGETRPDGDQAFLI